MEDNKNIQGQPQVIIAYGLNNIGCDQRGATFQTVVPEVSQKPTMQSPPNESERDSVNYTSRGPRKHALFENPDTHQEDVAVKNRERQRLCDYLSLHRLKSRQLVCAKGDTLNKTVVCFLKVWLEKGTISESPSGGAVFRFLTEDCELSTSVTERSYANEIKERLKEIKTGYDTEIYLMVKKCFEE